MKLMSRFHVGWQPVFFLFSFFLHAGIVLGQSRVVTGKVTDSTNGEPLAGVSVTIKDATTGAFTDERGQFTLNVSGTVTLVVSNLGFVTQEVPLGTRTSVFISLAKSDNQLGDVVVVAYGTQKKATLTGAIASVGAKNFQDRGPLGSPLAALQGMAPGVTVTRSSSQPGREGWNFQLRGATSINNTEPLIIMDGVPLPNVAALNSFNPADVESMSFLKDAAASIYGSRASGGVVLITTKRGKSGKPRIDYNGSLSVKKPGLMPKLMDISRWGKFTEESRVTDGFGATDLWYRFGKLAQYAVANNIQVLNRAEATATLTQLGLDPNGFFTDVRDFTFFPGTEQNVLWGNALSKEHQLSVAGSTDKAGYRVSLGYMDDGSLLQPGINSNQRYNIRLGHDYKFSQKLQLQSNISLERNIIRQPYAIGSILGNGFQPGKPLSGRGATGKPYSWGDGSVNVFAEDGGETKENNSRINTSFNLNYQLLPGLRLVGTAGYYYFVSDYRAQENMIEFFDYSGQFPTSIKPTRNSYNRVRRSEENYTLNGYAEYSKVFRRDHDVKVMAGAQYERFEMNQTSAKTFDLIAGVPPSLNLGIGDAASKSVGELQNHNAIAGYFSRVNYTFRNKYLFEANTRYDGSSKFDVSNRWRFFYGLLAGWRMSQENFLKDVDVINELKLRVSYGVAGNQNGIGNYDNVQLLNLAYSTGAGSAGFPILGTSPVVRITPNGTLVALDRSWERTETYNGGVDFALLKNRLSGSFDYFQKRNNNMLLNRTLAGVLGATPPQGNNGRLRTWGWELALNWRDRIGNITYHIGGNISDSWNKLVDFGGQKIISTNDRAFNNAVEGYPIGSYFGLVYAGRIQDERTLNDYRNFIKDNNVGMPSGIATAQANQRLALGDNMFKDVNGDGKITFPEDAVLLGTDAPRYSYSFNAGLEWKGFDFNAIFQGVGKRTIVRDGSWRIPGQAIFIAQNEAFVDQWWTPERTGAKLPRLSSTGTINNYNYFPSDWVAENGAYLRLKTLVIGYTLPAKITEKAKIQRLRIYFSGNDLWESSKIKDGWDPEATRTVFNSGDVSQRFPFYRYYSFGLNLTF